MGAHSLPGATGADAGRIAGTGVMAALALAGSAGVASAHGSGEGHDGDGQRGHTVTRVDDGDTTRTSTDPGGVCAVLGDLDLPGIDCSDDAGSSAVTPPLRTRQAPSTTSAQDDAPPDAAPQRTADTRPVAATSAQNTQNTQNAQGSQAPQKPQAQPKTSGNPIDAPGEPGTTRTLPIGG